MHLAVVSSSPQIRKDVNTALQASVAAHPVLTSRLVKDSVTSFLERGLATSTKATSSQGEEREIAWNKHGRLAGLLLSSVVFVDDLELAIREDLVAEYIVLAHHPLLCACRCIWRPSIADEVSSGTPSKQVWIDMCLRAKTDVHDLVDRKLEKIFKLIVDASNGDDKVWCGATVPARTS